MSRSAGEPEGEGDDFAPEGRGRQALRCALSLSLVPAFLGGLYLAAKAGIHIADRQVPVEGAPSSGVSIGSLWAIPAGSRLVIADSQQPLRDYDFQQSSSDPSPVDGVRELMVEAAGWELEVLPGGDRRYLRAKWLSGEREGDEFWLQAAQLERLGSPVGGGG